MPALLTTFGAFALILILARLKVPLSLSVLIGSAAVGLGFGLTPIGVLQTAGKAIVLPQTIGLLITVTFLLALSGTMQAAGQMEKMVGLASKLLRRPAVTMAALPALIGLLPMPGGALFSAPMVESAAGNEKVSPAKLSAINYWFRHVWEYWWPLYPGVIVAVTVTNSSFGNFAIFHTPMSVIMICSGLLILCRMHPNLRAMSPRAGGRIKRGLLKETAAIWLIIVIWVIVKYALLAAFGPQPKETAGQTGRQTLLIAMHGYLPILAGLVLSLIWTAMVNRLDFSTALRAWMDSRIYTMAFLVASVMIFQSMLDRANAPRQISQELTALHVPLLAVLTILPFIAGAVTGLAVGFAGTSLPIVMGLVAADPTTGSLAPYIALAYTFGHLGMMLSPMHLCQVVSNRYFNAGYVSVYRQMLPSAVLTGALGVAYFFCLKLILR